MKTRNLVAVLCVAAFAVPAFAQGVSTPRIDQRQASQEKRIDQGVQSDSLTGTETARLENGQNHVQNLENKATADGQVTAKERARIAHAQNKQSRHIYRKKHN